MPHMPEYCYIPDGYGAKINSDLNSSGGFSGTACLRRAQHTLTAQVQDMVATSEVGSQDAAAAHIVASYRDRFGDPTGCPPARHARRAGPGGWAAGDDGPATELRP